MFGTSCARARAHMCQFHASVELNARGSPHPTESTHSHSRMMGRGNRVTGVNTPFVLF